MPPARNPETIPSLPRAIARTAFKWVTMENMISDRSATARGVSAQRMPDLISALALSRDRFQPVTSCPAAMRRGTISCHIAPSPMKPSCTKPISLRRVLCSLTLNTKDVDGPHKAGLARTFPRSGQRGGLRQLVVAFAEPGQAHREADAFFGRLKDDECRAFSGTQLLDQLVVHDHFSDAAVWQAADEARAPDIRLVDLEPETRRQHHAERRDHAHQAAFLVGRLEHDHGEADIGTVFSSDALDQSTLLGFGAGRRIAADLPVFMHRLHGALGKGAVRGRERQQRGQRHRSQYESKPPRAELCMPGIA